MNTPWGAVFMAHLLAVAGQQSWLDVVQTLYLQQGLPFRENIYLGNLPILPAYDFVIIGSGPTGSVLANRLTERPDWTVLLIEKGLEGNIYNDIPFINLYTVLGNFSKIYPVEKEPGVCTGLENGRCHWPSGNGIGGATLINAMLSTRGHPSDYDRWADDGNPGWSYEEILPYFRKVENMSIEGLAESDFHGRDGPVHIEYPFQSNVGKRFLKAGQELGYDIVDYNNPNTMLGFSPSQISTKAGRRHSAASAYLLPVKSRKNLHVVKDTLATKILIDAENKHAYGVKFIKKNMEREVFARKEVIISAGAFGSPQLLMLSGIGIRSHLEEMDIPVIQELPVGNNLMEHLGTPALSFLINSTDSFPLPKIAVDMPRHFQRWLEGNKGVLSNNGAEALGYIKTPLAEDKADIELIFLPIQIGGDGGIMRKTFFVTDEIYEKTWKPIVFQEGFLIAPMVMYPRSRGTVRLKSTDPRDAPLIDANFFSDPYDIKVIIEGVRTILKVANTKAFREIGARQYDVPVFGCENFLFNSDEYWDCVIRHIPVQFHHQSGTCRMGPNPDIAVVDPRLKVHGVRGLRVADASIMPYIPGIHTMMPCYMIGEKAADLIKEDWNTAKS